MNTTYRRKKNDLHYRRKVCPLSTEVTRLLGRVYRLYIKFRLVYHD